MKFKIVIFRWL